MTHSIVSTDSKSTEKLGALLGKQLKGGEVIELVSDLGGGKTTFVRGLAAGSGSKDQVASPTFTLSKVYDVYSQPSHADVAQGAGEERKGNVQKRTSTAHRKQQRSDTPQAPAEPSASADGQAGAVRRLRIHHFDFYRLYGDAGIMEHEVKEAVHDPKSVVVIEWGKAVHKVLPKKHLVVKITNVSPTERKLTFSYPKTLSYLLEDI